MRSILVTEAGRKGFKVLVDFIQRGKELSSKENANHQASILHKKHPEATLYLKK